MARRSTDPPPEGFRALPRAARLYMIGLLVAGIAGFCAATVLGLGPTLQVEALIVLLVLAGGGAAFEALAPGHYALQPNYAFLFWGAVILPPWALLALAAVCFLPAWSWLARSTDAYKTTFNIVNFALTGLLVSAIAAFTDLTEAPAALGPFGVAALIAAAVLGAVVNHAMIVVVITLAEQERLRAALPQLMEGLPISVGVGLTGACLLLLWETSPWLVLVGAGPLALIYRSLWVPMLRHRADTDAKTGLYNLARFRAEFETLLADARRRNRRLAVAMVDLDYLRTINNTAGHLAGDRVIGAVADALAGLGAYGGVASRFGGEEFCVLLPGSTPERARELLEEVLAEIKATEFRSDDGDEPLRASFSAGIAVFGAHGDTVDDLLEAADQACYAAKAAGRSRVCVAPEAAAVAHAA